VEARKKGGCTARQGFRNITHLKKKVQKNPKGIHAKQKADFKQRQSQKMVTDAI